MAQDMMSIEYKNFRYWFTRNMAIREIVDSFNEFKIWDKETEVYIGTIVDSKEDNFGPLVSLNESGHDEELIKKEFSLFRKTCEGRVGDIIDIDNLSNESLKHVYVDLLIGVVNLRKFDGIDDHEKKGYRMWSNNIHWLNNTDFFVAPASTIYHDAEEAGLLRHTLRVYNNMMELYKLNKFKDVPLGSAALVALVHDWCKIGLYEKFMRNVKDENTGRWHQEPGFRHVIENVQVPGGHGATSMFLATRMFSANVEEAMAIRWHMGEYNVAPNEGGELCECNERYPLVFMLQFADRLSIVKY